MKNRKRNLVRLGLFLASSAVVSTSAADPKSTPQAVDISEQQVAGQLCASALVSRSALKEKARDLGVSISRIKHLECNQIPALALIESSQGVEPQFDVRNLANIE